MSAEKRKEGVAALDEQRVARSAVGKVARMQALKRAADTRARLLALEHARPPRKEGRPRLARLAALALLGGCIGEQACKLRHEPRGEGGEARVEDALLRGA